MFASVRTSDSGYVRGAGVCVCVRVRVRACARAWQVMELQARRAKLSEGIDGLYAEWAELEA